MARGRGMTIAPWGKEARPKTIETAIRRMMKHYKIPERFVRIWSGLGSTLLREIREGRKPSDAEIEGLSRAFCLAENQMSVDPRLEAALIEELKTIRDRT
jgi:hypothetical protein